MRGWEGLGRAWRFGGGAKRSDSAFRGVAPPCPAPPRMAAVGIRRSAGPPHPAGPPPPTILIQRGGDSTVAHSSQQHEPTTAQQPSLLKKCAPSVTKARRLIPSPKCRGAPRLRTMPAGSLGPPDCATWRDAEAGWHRRVRRAPCRCCSALPSYAVKPLLTGRGCLPCAARSTEGAQSTAPVSRREQLWPSGRLHRSAWLCPL